MSHHYLEEKRGLQQAHLSLLVELLPKGEKVV